MTQNSKQTFEQLEQGLKTHSAVVRAKQGIVALPLDAWTGQYISPQDLIALVESHDDLLKQNQELRDWHTRTELHEQVAELHGRAEAWDEFSQLPQEFTISSTFDYAYSAGYQIGQKHPLQTHYSNVSDKALEGE